MPESGMHATTDPADAYRLPQWAAAPTDNTMSSLYSAALGPVNRDDYLSLFARFDATGRTTATWNWAASLCTLNWMVFRQVWSAALIYVAAAEGLALLVFGLGRQFLNWPQGVEWGVMAAFALLAFAVPGLFGNAILHADIRRRIARALAASRTVPEACELLNKKASSRKRLQWLVAANLALAAVVTLAYLALPKTGVQNVVDASMTPSVTVADAASAAKAAVSARDAALPMEPPASAVASPTAATASAPDIPPPPEPEAPAPAPPAAKAPAPKAEPPPVLKPAPRPAATPAPTPSAAPAASGVTAPAPDASAPLTVVGSTLGYYINVGLFAEESNARKAQSRLLNEGLPAFRQELHGAKGRRIRVRVGPFDDRAQADAAAQAIRAMALEAVVFKQ